MRFADIPGLLETKRRLIAAVQNNKIAHAQMYVGQPGGANLAMALAYITYVNCENKGAEDSCGQCPSCLKLDKLVHPDLHFVFPNHSVPSKDKDAHRANSLTNWRTFLNAQPYRMPPEWPEFNGAANKQVIISVEEGREIIRSIALKAFESPYKVVLIWLPELMNQAAANAILKVLEEPPERTLFLLVSNNSEQNLTTIISRCQLVQIDPLADQDIEQYLTQQLGTEETRAKQATHIVNGNLAEAIRLSGEMSNTNHTFFRDWMRACFGRKIADILRMSEDYQKFAKEDQKGLFQYGTNVLRELLLHHSATPELLRVAEEEQKFVEGFGKVVDMEKLERMVGLFSDAYYHVERNASPKIVFTDLSLTIARFLKDH